MGLLNAHTGLRSIRLNAAQNTAVEHPSWNTNIPGADLQVGAEYRLSAWIKTQARSAYLSVGWWDENALFHVSTSAYVNGTTDWALVSISFTVLHREM